MNSLFLSSLTSGYSTPVTGVSTTFKSASFYAISGFNSTNGLPIYNNSGIYIGIESGRLPMVASGGVPYTISYNDTLDGLGNLNQYYVLPQRANEGCYVLFD